MPQSSFYALRHMWLFFTASVLLVIAKGANSYTNVIRSPISSLKNDGIVHRHPLSLAASPLGGSVTSPVQAGDKLPWAVLHWGFNPPQFIDLPLYCGTRSVIIVGITGAFVDNDQVPSFIEHSDDLKQLGVDEVIVYAVNDGAVMGVYQKEVDTRGTIVSFFADPDGQFTDLCGMRRDEKDEVDMKFGLIGRCKTFVAYVEGCIVRHVAVVGEGGVGEDSTLAPSLIKTIRAIRKQ